MIGKDAYIKMKKKKKRGKHDKEISQLVNRGDLSGREESQER